MKVGILGLGQAGTTIAGVWNSTGSYNVGCLNITKNDELKSTGIKNKYLIADGSLGGMAKERKNIVTAIENDKENILTFLKKFINENQIEALILISSSGGGTGSGLISRVCKMLDGRLAMRCILITPDVSNCMSEMQNTIEVISELQSYNTSIRLVSNDKYKFETDETSKFEKINEYIINSEIAILSAPNEIALGKNLDAAEAKKLLFTRGFSSVYHICLKHDESMSDKLIDYIKKSLDFEPNFDKAVKYLGFIYHGNQETSKTINEGKIQDIIGTPESKFHCTLEKDKEKVYLITAGGNVPESNNIYIEQFKKQQENHKSFKPKNLQTNLIKLVEETKEIYKVEMESNQNKKKESENWLDDLNLD